MLYANSAGTANNKWQLMMSLFQQLNDLPSNQRHSFLEEHCSDADMRVQLTRMMDSLEQTQLIMDKSMFVRVKQEPTWRPEDWIGKHLDQFDITEVINEGGMGVVFKARQEEPVQRDVAIKMIRSDAPESFTERFRFEQSSLAKLNHPNIATIHTVGVTEDGSPYLVMEYIEGETLLHHCNKHRLSIDERLSLFIQVCDAIGFCHQRGILHRDIKPANVIIRRLESGDIPIVIDFGIAASEYHRTASEQESAGFGGMGTPEYMSPEHLLDVAQMDARADIYSLGCLLFSLLAGKSSFDVDKFRSLNANDRKDMIRTFTPGLPSQHAKSLSEQEQHMQASVCGDSVKQWLRKLSEDLDWIYRKAAAKNPNQRYASVFELGNDIRRFFRHEPVQARPRSRRYLFRQFFKRNKTLTASVVVILSITLAFLVMLLSQNQQIKAQFERAEAQRQIAEQERSVSEQVTELLTNIFSSADPYHTKKEPQTVVEVLNKGLVTLREDTELNEVIRYKILIKLAEVYTNLAEQNQAIEIAESILARDGWQDVETDIRAHLVIAESNELLGQYDKALEHANIVYQMAKTAQRDKKWLAQATIKLSSYYVFNNEYEKAHLLAQEAVSVNSDLYGEAHLETARAYRELGMTSLELEKLAASQTALDKALEIYRNILHPDDLEISQTMLLIGLIMYKNGSVQDMIETMEPAVENLKKILGDEHPDYIAALNNLTLGYATNKQYQKALNNMELVAAYFLKESGEASKIYMVARINLGAFLIMLGRYAEAQGKLKQLQLLAKKYVPDDTLILGETYRWLGLVSLLQENYETARQYATQSVDNLNITFAGGHTKVFNALLYLTFIEIELNHFEQAQRTAEEAINMFHEVPLTGESSLLLAKASSAYAQYQQNVDENQKRLLMQYVATLQRMEETNKLHLERVQGWLVETEKINRP